MLLLIALALTASLVLLAFACCAFFFLCSELLPLSAHLTRKNLLEIAGVRLIEADVVDSVDELKILVVFAVRIAVIVCVVLVIVNIVIGIIVDDDNARVINFDTRQPVARRCTRPVDTHTVAVIVRQSLLNGRCSTPLAGVSFVVCGNSGGTRRRLFGHRQCAATAWRVRVESLLLRRRWNARLAARWLLADGPVAAPHEGAAALECRAGGSRVFLVRCGGVAM